MPATTMNTRRTQLSRTLALCSLLFSLPIGLMAQDVDFIFVIKEQHYEQSGEHIVSLLEEDWMDVYDAPFIGEVGVETPDTSQITSILVTPPSGPDFILDENDENEGIEEFEGYGSLTDLNNNVPNGTYQFDFDTLNDGAKSVTLDLTGDDYISLTKFTGYESCQNIDPANSKTFNWDAITNGLASDWIFFEIEDEFGDLVFESPEPGEVRALTGQSTSVTIPGGILSPGTNYSANLFLIRPVDTNEDYSPGVTAVAAYGKSLEMEIRTTGNSGEFNAPVLEQVAPNWSAVDVDLNSVVTFVFNEMMNTSVDESQAITWTGVTDPAQFEYSWSPDGQRLFCNYAPGLPASTTIGWHLNPMDSATKLRDLEGNVLNNWNSGEFTTADTSNIGALDVERIGVFKGQFYEQTSAGSATFYDQFIDLNVSLSGVSTVSSMDLLTPSGSVTSTNIGMFEWDHRELRGEALFAEADDLDFIFPSGTYNLTLHTVNDGVQSVDLELTSSAYPNAPVIQNFAATQAWDSTQPLTLQWNPMSGGTTSDIIVLYVESENACFVETPDIGVTGALDGTATSFTVPANTLPPGRNLELEIAFIKALTNDTTQYPGVISASGIASVTAIEIQTLGEPLKPTVDIAFTGTTPALTVMGEKGRQYQLKTSPDLQIWTDDATFWINGDGCEGILGSSNEFIDIGGESQPHRFYQLIEVE
jgi:hypothetical protein